jgi:hypothetical protein
MADSLAPEDLIHCGHKWLNRLVPFFQPQERRPSGILREPDLSPPRSTR